ncbi:MAG: NADH-quinone oxidoreductase subunit L, partial [Actinomycetota bacterium]
MVETLTSHEASVLWLIPAIPLAVATLNLFVGKRLGRWAGVLATVAVAVSFAISVAVVADLLGRPAGERLALQHLFD